MIQFMLHHLHSFGGTNFFYKSNFSPVLFYRGVIVFLVVANVRRPTYKAW